MPLSREQMENLALRAIELQAQAEEEEAAERQREARRAGKAKKRYIERDREGGFEQLWNDYFCADPTYPPELFRRRFRMRRPLFMRICQALAARHPYFQQLPDATGRLGLHPIQKCTVALRQLAYGGSSDQFDEYLRIADSTGRECLKKFCEGIVAAFGDEYLRRPTQSDVARLIRMHEAKHGFPGMLGSIDCMHWAWRNCPAAWKGAYANYKKGCPTIILEAVASTDLWIWHAFYGVAGSNNDINVLNQSDVFNDYLRGQAPAVSFRANNKTYSMGYYLADGIYPRWPTFVKTLSCPTEPKRQLYAQKQESARKDIERAFGVLQARWAIIRGPAKLWYIDNLCDIMYACIIMHNMIIEDEGPGVEQWEDDESATSSSSPPNFAQGVPPAFADYMDRQVSLRDARQAQTLENDMIEEMWERFGNED